MPATRPRCGPAAQNHSGVGLQFHRSFGRQAVPKRWAILIILSAFLAFALEAIRLPAALLLGSMIAAIIVAIAAAGMRVAPQLVLVAQAVIGCMIARSIPPTIIGEILRGWPLFVAVVIAIIAASGALGWLLTRWRALPGTTAVWGSSPGAASAMMLMAAAYGADIRLVAFCTTEAEYPVDIIVFATGFDAMTGPLLRMDLRGRDGIALKDVWEAGPHNYLGLQIAGFPNLFTITGPGSPSVLCNMPVAIEQHADWIADCIEHMRSSGLERIEARPEAVETWVGEVNEVANRTLLPMAKHSWYLGANIPGKPRVFMPYAGGMIRYREICRTVATQNYDGFALS